MYGRLYIPVRGWTPHYLNCVIAGFIMLLTMLTLIIFSLNDWLSILLTTIVGSSAFFVVLIIRKDEPALKLKKELFVSKIMIKNM